MSRHKIPTSNNFYIDELIHPDIYKRFGRGSLKFINPKLLEVLASIRDLVDEPVTINNWASGGRFINSGLRDIKHPYNGKLGYSRHYYGMCLDLKFKTKSIKEVFNLVMENHKVLKLDGLTVIEDIKHTPTWLHISVEYTGLDNIKIIKP